MAETRQPNPDITSNVLRINSDQTSGFFLNRAKDILKVNTSMEIHALGFAINNAVRAAEMLRGHGYASIVSIETMTVTERAKNYKVLIVLNRTPEFFDLDQAYLESIERTS
jgi:DNA-binding protein